MSAYSLELGHLLPLAVTTGEPAGVGPDIAMAAWQRRKFDGLCPFFMISDPELLERRSRDLGWNIPIEVANPDTATEIFQRALPVYDIGKSMISETGSASKSTAEAVIKCIETAVDLSFNGQCRAIVTNPIHKFVLNSAGFNYPGHTEFLAALADKYTGEHSRPVMMLAGPELRTIPLTVHIPLSQVPNLISEDLIIETAKIAETGLRTWFNIPHPRIAVCGLNPHSGEDGLIGCEEMDIITPAIKKLQADGLNIYGPIAADSLFRENARQSFDAALAMYHDQALIPVKTLSFHNTVNITIGLPFARTSPDHGTALDIAGTGRASPQSLMASIRMADAMTRDR